MIVVSNRLPFVLTRDKDGRLQRNASAGGLVTAVSPVVIECEGVWVGWTGLADYQPHEPIPESQPDDTRPTAGLKAKQIVPVIISDAAVFDQYYNGCCNGTFWPLFHSMPDRAVFHAQTWQAYCVCNDAFAFSTLDAIRKIVLDPSKAKPEVPIVWIHDYHLMLASNQIRDTCDDEGIKIRLGFFMHIPFPSWDIMRIFPWCDEILQGLLGCDLVGFHIEDYCLNFIDCCRRCLGCRVDREKMLIEHCGRTVIVKALPIGIPYERFSSMAKLVPRVYPADVKVVLGVDRLDYTKGLVARLKAFERLLQKYPKWIEKVILLQVAVPSRKEVKEYIDLKEEIDKLVGRINGSFTTPAWSPIRYIYGQVSQDKLTAFYRDAVVGLITPLRDGMNLVAKEFVACQDDKDPGVLILSPFAGAGGLMQEALLVNPYEVENVADQLNKALEMPLDERQLRMSQLKKREKRMDVDSWVQGFLTSMGAIYQEDSLHTGLIAEQSISKMNVHDFDQSLSPLIDNCTKIGLILDFDGTLSPLANTPDLASIMPEIQKCFERLSSLSDVHITVMSGRPLENLQQKVGVAGITLAGNHGLEILHPDGTKFSHPMPPGYLENLALLKEELTKECTIDGAWVEEKGLLVAWHYRLVPVAKLKPLRERAASIYLKYNFEYFEPAKRMENRPPNGWNRGRSSIHVLRSLFGVDWEERVQVIYAGDSDADEDAMETLKGIAYSYRIISEDATVITKSWADARLQGPEDVLTMLKFVEKKLSGRKIKPMRSSLPGAMGSINRAESLTEEMGDLSQIVIAEGMHISLNEDMARPRSSSFTCMYGTKFRRPRASNQVKRAVLSKQEKVPPVSSSPLS